MYIRAKQIDVAYAGTLDWLFGSGEASPGLRNWLLEGQDVFWIQGKPGCGKSTVMKHLSTSPETKNILQSTSKTQNWIIVGFFFTEQGREAQRSWECMLRTMLYELLKLVPALVPVVFDVGKRASERSESLRAGSGPAQFAWDVKTLEDALLRCKLHSETAFKACFFIDALDEHTGDQQQVGDFLKCFGRHIPSEPASTIKVCVASRPFPAMKDLLGKCPGLKVDKWTRRDIHAYVNTRLQSNHRIDQFLSDSSRASGARNLLKQVKRRANGVFLWVRLVIDELWKGLVAGDSIEDLERRLNELPDDLYDFFRQMLEKVDPRYSNHSYLILESVLCARRPLTVMQIAMVLYSNLDEAIKSGDLTGEWP
jgi:hypothetical protein